MGMVQFPSAAAAGRRAMPVNKRFKWTNAFPATFKDHGVRTHTSQICFQIISAIGEGILSPGRLYAV